MKYLLFDVSILAVLLAAALQLLGYGAPPPAPAPPECDPPDSGVPASEFNASGDDAIRERAQEARPRDVFERGETVRVYDPAIRSQAFQAKIYKKVPADAGKEARAYEILAGPHMNEVLRGIDPSQIRPRAPYEYNTPAICNIGVGIENNAFRTSAGLAPCRVLAEVNGGENYKLWGARPRDESPGYYEMPWWRVRAIDGASPVSVEASDAEMEKRPDDARDPANNGGSNMTGVVELFGGAMIFPAIVTDHYEANGRKGYELRHLIPDDVLQRVDGKFLSPYRIYGDGTGALCKVDPVREERWDYEMVKCTILSHSVREIGFVSYQVSYEGRGKVLVTESLHFSRVCRLAVPRDEH